MTLAEEGGICKAMESHQAADDELEMYAMKNNSLGIKSKCKHETYTKFAKQDSPSRGCYVFIGSPP
jgi:hypothetical protein